MVPKGCRRRQGIICNGCKGNCWDDGNILYLDCGYESQLYTFIKPNITIQLVLYINYTSINLAERKPGFPNWCSGKESACQCRRCKRLRFSPWMGRSPGVGNGNPSETLTWKIPWTEEPGRIQSVGLQRGAHSWARGAWLLQRAGHDCTTENTKRTEWASSAVEGKFCIHV